MLGPARTREVANDREHRVDDTANECRDRIDWLDNIEWLNNRRGLSWGKNTNETVYVTRG